MTTEQKLIKKLEEYIQLLSDEMHEITVFSYIHGWRSKKVEEGMKLRKEIKQLKNQITSL